MGFSRKEYWSRLPYPTPGDLPNPGIEPESLTSPAWQADSLPLAPPSTIVVQSLSHVWLCDPINCSIPGFRVLHHLPELAQMHVHWVSGAIQPSHPLLSLSPPALYLSQHQGLFNESVLHIRWPKYQSFSFSISPSNNIQDWSPLELTGLMSLQSKGFSSVFFNTTVQSISSSVLSLVGYNHKGHKSWTQLSD